MNNNKKPILRFLLCGNINDGKNTLIKQLLYNNYKINNINSFLLNNKSNNINIKDQIYNSVLLKNNIYFLQKYNFSIYVSNYFFSTKKRKFVIINPKSHEKHIKNIIISSYIYDIPILLIDVSKGILDQTYKYNFIITLLKIKKIIIILNKMDLINYKESIFDKYKKDCIIFFKKISYNLEIIFIPLSSLYGDNIICKSQKMSWYNKPTLLDVLDSININNNINIQSSYFIVKHINRINSNDYGYFGILSSGILKVGQKIKIIPSNQTSIIKQIFTGNDNLKIALPKFEITLVLKDKININRGDVIVNVNEALQYIKNVLIHIIWMSKKPLLSGCSYKIIIDNKKNNIIVKNIYYQININSLEKYKTDKIIFNEIGLIEVFFDKSIILNHDNNYYYKKLIVIDSLSNMIIGIGFIRKVILNEDKIQNNHFELKLNTLIHKYFLN